jgi:glycosyltransferase involved in cell wall biosynthesis
MKEISKVSIVLPTYNGSRFLEQAVRSILAQTFQDWELNIVDDASTDETPRLIDKFMAADPRIRSIRHTSNRKLPAALNTGFAQAQGKYLTWTSDDNCYRPEALDTMVKVLDSNSEFAVVYSGYTIINELGEPVKYIDAAPIKDLVKKNCVGACFLYRREVQDTLGGYAEDLFLVEDYDFWLRASIKFKLLPIHKDLYLFRQHPSSLTSTKKALINSKACETLAKHLPVMSWAPKSVCSAGYLRIAFAAQSNGDVQSVKENLFKAIKFYPLSLFHPIAVGLLVYSFLGPNTFRYFQSVYRSLKKIFHL